MTPEKKKIIDKFFLNTDLGMWLNLIAEDKVEKANSFVQKKSEELFNKGFFEGFEHFRKVNARQIADELKSIDELDEYMQFKDEENYKLVGAIVSTDFYGDIYDTIMKRLAEKRG